MAFGAPVVPEVNWMLIGSSNCKVGASAMTLPCPTAVPFAMTSANPCIPAISSSPIWIIVLRWGSFAEDNALGSRFPDSPCARGASAKSLITYVTDRPGHDTRYAINASKIMTELGYDPQEGFDSGLKKTIDWYLSNQNWWQSIQDGSYRK